MDNIYSNSFFSTINLPTHRTASSKTLTDNIFYNDICKILKAGNIATIISDHLTQLLVIPIKETPILSTHNIIKPSFEDFNPTEFKNELTKINWKNKLQIEKNNPHLSLRSFLKLLRSSLIDNALSKKYPKRSYKQKP